LPDQKIDYTLRCW